jgi:cell division protein ZapA
MSTVTLSIGPKSYTVACADGQEAHIRALGGMIAEKYAQLGSARAPLEAQNLLFAALFLADELAEARKRTVAAPEPVSAPEPDGGPADGEVGSLRETIARLEAELAAAHEATAGTEAGDLAQMLEALADRAEANAAALEAAAANA